MIKHIRNMSNSYTTRYLTCRHLEDLRTAQGYSHTVYMLIQKYRPFFIVPYWKNKYLDKRKLAITPTVCYTGNVTKIMEKDNDKPVQYNPRTTEIVSFKKKKIYVEVVFISTIVKTSYCQKQLYSQA